MGINLKAKIKGTSNYIELLTDANGNLLTTFPQENDSAGKVKILSAGGKEITTTENGFLRSSTPNLIFYDQVDGNAVNTNKWNPYSVSGMTIVQSSGYIILNAGAVITANAYAILTSLKYIPLYGTLPLVVDFNAKVLNVPESNATIELGIGAATTNTAPTDGAFFRWAASGAFYCVINSGGNETSSVNLSGQTFTAPNGVDTITMPPSTTEVEVYTIETVEDKVLFYVGDILVATIGVPIGQSYPFNSGRQTLFARVYNGGSSPSLAPQISIGQVVVSQEDITQNKDWFDLLSSLGLGAYQSPVTPFAQTPNHANSTSPVSATLSNTAAGYATLGGRFQFAAVAGAATDYALFAFQNTSGYQLYIKNIAISMVNTGAIGSAITPTIMDWGIGVNGSGVSLATVDGTNTWAARRVPLGMQAFGVSSIIGSMPPDLIRRFDYPLVVDSGRYIHIILQIFSGAATASQIFRGDVVINAINE